MYWSSEEVAEFQELDTINEAYNLRTVFDTAVQRLCSGGNGNGNTAQYRPAEVAYALSLVHSRSFLSSGVHVWVPAPPRPSIFELVAGEQGIQKGEEVTISYGKWPKRRVFYYYLGLFRKEMSTMALFYFKNLDEIVEFIAGVIAQGTGVEAESIDPIKDTDSRKQWYTELSKELSAGGEEEEGAVSVDIENDYTRMGTYAIWYRLPSSRRCWVPV
ncbi:hypothetical protein KSW81_003270 [Nannochloris sp. 'desiccata']|nr:hypothetical protein KSW81_003270 [Chlorella desiccata (nom. nud.)]